MSVKRRLRNVCLALFAVLLLLFGLTTTTAYLQGGLTPSQYMASMYVTMLLLAVFAYTVIHWRN